jgi:hypothetical protein
MLSSGFVLTALSLGWLDRVMTSDTPFNALALPLFVSGIAQSMLLVPLIVGVLSTTPAELNSRVAPIITLFVQLGGSISSAASIAFFDRRTAFHASVLAGASNAQHLSALGAVPSASLLERLGSLLAVPLVFAFPRSQKSTA